MAFFPVFRPTHAHREAVIAARVIAVLADLVQLVFLPVFGEGFASPVNDALDVVVAIVMVCLVGWHVAFLPAFVVEALPFGDLAPSWTLAVLLATRSTGAGPDRQPAGISPPG